MHANIAGREYQADTACCRVEWPEPGDQEQTKQEGPVAFVYDGPDAVAMRNER